MTVPSRLGLPEYATILAFDVGIDAEAREHAEENNVRLFFAEIIYHLFDQFSAYMKTFHEAKKATASNVVVFPCVLKIFPNYIFNKKVQYSYACVCVYCYVWVGAVSLCLS